MANSKPAKVAVACQGGGMHAAFAVGVLDEILQDYEKKKFELVGLSGTSAGALCALMAWYGLAPKKGRRGSPKEARDALRDIWDSFVARTGSEIALNAFTYCSFRAEEQEIPMLGVTAPIPGLNPYGLFYNVVAASLPYFGVRKQYFDLGDLLDEACPEFDSIDWEKVDKRLLIGASEVVEGFETVFDSNVNKAPLTINKGMRPKDKVSYWRQRLPLSLGGVAASGTLPVFRRAEYIEEDGYYWDGLYSHNPPVREFFSNANKKEDKPDELWIIRINPQQWPEPPETHKDIQDRENELMGNLSLNKELDFIQQVNDWMDHKVKFGNKYKRVIVRTIKMKQGTADDLQYSSKFNRSRGFLDELRDEGQEVARRWLDSWPNDECYPEDAGYPKNKELI
jgi:NTE family protein